MARSYPRFLLSNPTNTKSVGPFIVHTIFPKGILKVDTSSNIVFFIEVWDVCTNEERMNAEKDAAKWLHYQNK